MPSENVAFQFAFGIQGHPIMPEQSKIFTESAGACTGGRIMILLIDNYDSFSYNLYQLVGEIEPNIKVIRNDEMTVDEIKELNPDRIILSPDPGRPEDAGAIMEVVKTIGKDIPVLGVCLGHQAICAAFGTTVTYAKKRMHGKQSNVKFDIFCAVIYRLSRSCSGCALPFPCSSCQYHTGMLEGHSAYRRRRNHGGSA